MNADPIGSRSTSLVLTFKDGEEEEEEVKVEVKQEEEDKFNWDSASMMPDVIATRAKVGILIDSLFYLSFFLSYLL